MADPVDHDLALWSRLANADRKLARWREEWAALEAYLQDDHADDTLAVARRAYLHTSVAWSEEDAWVYMPLVGMFASRLSVTFDVAPSTYLVRRGSEDPLPDTDPNVVQWRADEQHLDLPSVLQDLERRVTVLSSPMSAVTWAGDRIQWHTYAPHDVRVLASSTRPDDLQLARVIGLRVRLGHDRQGNPQPDQWLCYTYDETTMQRGVWMVDEMGRRVSAPVFADGWSSYGCHPLVMWSWERPARGCLFVPPRASLLAAQRALNLGETDLHHGLRYNAHPARVRYGQTQALPGQRVSDTQVGPGTELLFGDRQTGGLEFVTPQLNTAVHRESLEAMLQKLAVMNGLPPDAFATHSAQRNLGAMQEIKAELQRIRSARQPVIRRLLTEQFRVHRAVGNAWADTVTLVEQRLVEQYGPGNYALPRRYRYDDDVELRLEVVERTGVEDRQSAAQATAIELESAQTSPVELEMSRAGTTRAEAQAAVDRRVRDNGRGVPVPAAQTQQNGT